MKRGIILVLSLLLVSVFSLNLTAAASCIPNVTLLNQDPYPSVPGEYTTLVFQVNGVDNSECNDIIFELLEEYPIEFDPGISGIKVFKKIEYLTDFSSTILIPYDIRINENAIDGSNEIKTLVQSRGDGELAKNFDIEVEGSIVDFEAYVKEYSYTTNEITIEVLNIGESDIKALTMEIPKQGNIEIKGSNRVTVGDLDSNEYTSADFEANPTDGIIRVNLIYTDAINVRREVTKDVVFDSSYFTGRVADEKSNSGSKYLILAVVAVLIIYLFFRGKKNSKLKK